MTMAKPSTRIYTVIDTEYLRKNLPGYSEERKNTQRGISALLFSAHQKHLIRANGAVSIPSSIMESHIGVSRELFRRINKKYGFFDTVDSIKFGISRQLIPTEMTRQLVDGLFTQNKAHRLFECTNIGGKSRYKRVTGKTEVVIQGYLVRNYVQDISKDYLEIVKSIGYPKETEPNETLNYFINNGYEYKDIVGGTEDDIKRFIVDNHNVRRDTFISNLKSRHNYKRSDPFFYSTEWKVARLSTLEKYGAVCLLCGSEDSIHVDHIFPRSKFPDLELDVDNLQPLCTRCNHKKSNTHFWDCRPIPDEEKLALAEKAGYDYFAHPNEFDVKTTIKCRKIDYWGQFEDNGA